MRVRGPARRRQGCIDVIVPGTAKLRGAKQERTAARRVCHAHDGCSAMNRYRLAPITLHGPTLPPAAQDPHGSRMAREDPLVAGERHEGLEPARFRLHNGPAESRHSIISSAFVVLVGRGTLVAFLDQLELEQALQDGVEGPGPQRDEAVGAPADFLDDSISMAVGVGEREEHLEDNRRER